MRLLSACLVSCTELLCLMLYLSLCMHCPTYSVPLTHTSLLRSLYPIVLFPFTTTLSHYPLPITHYPLPITHYPLPITHHPSPITLFLFIQRFTRKRLIGRSGWSSSSSLVYHQIDFYVKGTTIGLSFYFMDGDI